MQQFEARELSKIKAIVMRRLEPYRGVRAYLFGSRARGTARMMSDVDVGLANTREVPRRVLSDIREALDESSIVLTVEIVDLDAASDAFREQVLKHGVPWIDYVNESTSQNVP